MELCLGFLGSGGGSNIRAILDNIENGFLDADPRVIMSNNPNSGVIQTAKNREIPQFCYNQYCVPLLYGSVDEAICTSLVHCDVNVVILGGYMKKIGPMVLEEYKGRILNIHPSLLPKYGGKGMYGSNVHKAVLGSGDQLSGATIHIVNEIYDDGAIISQRSVPVLDDDTPGSLGTRVLALEHQLFSDVLRKIQHGEINLNSFKS